MDETPFQKLIRLEMDARGLNPNSFTKAAGLKADVIRDLMRGKSTYPRIDTIASIASYLKLSIAELLKLGFPELPAADASPFGSMDAAGSDWGERPAKGIDLKPIPASRADDGIEYEGRAYAALPVYDVMVSAGPGSFNGDHNDPEGWALLSLDQVRTVTRADIAMLALIRVSGDSMTPTLMNNDQILVDRSIRKVGRDGMYVIAMGDEVQVKRISRDLATRTLTVASDNEIYPTSEGVAEDGVTVLGRVVWISRNVGG